MAAPRHVSRKLQDTLGTEASDAMVDWMNQVDAQHIEVRQEIAELRRDMRGDIAELRQELHREVGGVRQDMAAQFAEVHTQFADVRVSFARVETRFAEAAAAADRRHADFMKWTLGFWAVSLATMMGGLAALARVLR
jgi:hypothetical protein